MKKHTTYCIISRMQKPNRPQSPSKTVQFSFFNFQVLSVSSVSAHSYKYLEIYHLLDILKGNDVYAITVCKGETKGEIFYAFSWEEMNDTSVTITKMVK